MNSLWCNGQWLALDDFPSHASDRGLLHGLGLFETLLAVDGKPVFPQRHLARLRAASQRLGWKLDFPDFRETVEELLVRNQLAEGRAKVRLTMTAGSGTLRDLSSGADRLVWMSAHSLEGPPTRLSVCISPWRRNAHSPLAGLKCASYAENLIALDHARRHGFDETLFLNTSGDLCEAATANLFLVKNGSLFTPSLESGCLPGITREVVIEFAARLGISCNQSTLTSAELEAADECFLTSSTRGIVPVTQVDQRMLSIGPVTGQLAASWSECLISE